MKKVLLFGTFDILHMGHIHLFKKAREYGDYLVVSVARDINVEKIKGYGPVHKEEERKEILSYLRLIDEVRLGYLNDPYQVINEVQPEIIALGYDQKVYVDKLEEAITGFGLNIKIVRIPSYNKEKYKSKKIRKYIEKMV